MGKLLILSVQSIITSQICYLSLIVAGILSKEAPDIFDQGAFLVFVLAVLYPVEVALNYASLYLTNTFAEKHYELCCSSCHSCCNRHFVQRIAAKRILEGKHGQEIAIMGHKL